MLSDEFTKKVGINKEKIKVIKKIKIKNKQKLCLNIKPPINKERNKFKLFPLKYIKLLFSP